MAAGTVLALVLELLLLSKLADDCAIAAVVVVVVVVDPKVAYAEGITFVVFLHVDVVVALFVVAFFVPVLPSFLDAFVELHLDVYYYGS